MKKLLLFICLCSALPLFALNEAAPEHALAAPTDEPIYKIYSSNIELNSQRAIRLGYKNFKSRINTRNATSLDIEIATLITTGFEPLFNKIGQLQDLPEKERAKRVAQYNREFENLALQLAQLLFKNQRRYTAPAFLDDQAALQETLQIIQEAIENGSF